MVAFANNQPAKNNAVTILPRAGFSAHFARDQTRVGWPIAFDEAHWAILSGRVNGHASADVLTAIEMVSTSSE